MKKGIRSPFFYVGDKYKLMPQLNKLFPNNINQFIEPFVGGGSVFLNALSKYEVGNPYKKNLNHNNPFKLLLSLLKRLKNAHLTPLSVKEIPILLCWKDDNANGLYDYIIRLRQEIVTINKTEFSYSDEFIYEKCLKLLESTNKIRFKMSQINEAVDEYIRKMRITGLISLRGNGRFIDINTNENNK
ncbi:hypothetical protein CHC119_07120 [Helicobacter pylori]